MLRRNYLQIIFLFYISLTFGNGLEYLKYFMKVQHAGLKDAKTLMTLDVDAFNCSKSCFETSACKSFVNRTISPSCILYEEDSKERMLIKITNTHFYQLRRSVPTKYRDGRCPVNLIYNAHTFIPTLSTSVSGVNYAQCFNRCEAEPNCQSFHYAFLNCIMSNYNYTYKPFHVHKGYIYTDINREKETNDFTAYSTFSFKPNPYPNLVTEAQMDAHSVLDCSRLCLISSTLKEFPIQPKNNDEDSIERFSEEYGKHFTRIIVRLPL
ncbi:uncharacterized protein LOC118766702 [Octopus sinensis]|uniref:Uncharacterized protein LOC118766702 n=1 Tax=Octopus sinensis TaxID=2607531 RepID=A0A7E6FFB3_9MOLL|nr:uncharacterized protein LOC118766702 [Octopus sinensis]